MGSKEASAIWYFTAAIRHPQDLSLDSHEILNGHHMLAWAEDVKAEVSAAYMSAVYTTNVHTIDSLRPARIYFRTYATSEMPLQLLQPHAGNEMLVQNCSLPISCVNLQV